jgi:uncharacterized protein involved in response to NO
MGIPRYRPFAGPALFRQGFRPFFFGAGLWAVIAIALWLPAFTGAIHIPTVFDPVSWHAHEMLFGFVLAAMSGFLLTAIPNWTGRMPLQGWPLIALFAAWAAGRLAMSTSALIGGEVAAALELSYLAILGAVVAREIVAGSNWRNLPMLAGIAALLLADALSHVEALGLAGLDGHGYRLAIGVIVMMISLVGGRIIPSFTRNWLVKRGGKRLPAAFGMLDRVALALVFLAALLWVCLPGHRATGVALLAAGAASFVRLARWRGVLCLGEPLVWSLHLAFAWLAAGLFLSGLAVLWPAVPPAAALHALTAGAMASMIVAVATRAVLGNTGRALAADGWTRALYLLVGAAALGRVAAPFFADAYLALLCASAVAWVAAFGLFTVRFGRMLLVRA